MGFQDRDSRKEPLTRGLEPPRLLCAAPWLQLYGALLAFLLIAFFTVIQSDLGHHISPGESPFFQWIRIHIATLLWLGVTYLLLAAFVQYLGFRAARREYPRAMRILAGCEVVALGTLATAFQQQWDGIVPWGHTVLQASLLLQVFAIFWCVDASASRASTHLLELTDHGRILFLSSLFFFAAIPASLDPSWQRMQEYVQLDSSFEIIWSTVLPSVLSGTTGLWFGIGTLGILGGLKTWWTRRSCHVRVRRILSFLPFLAISGLYGAIGLGSLAYAMAWELRVLHLTGAMLPLFIFLCGGGGALGYAAFRRLAPHAPRAGNQSLIGMAAFSMAAVPLFPITWLLTRPHCGRRSWRLLLASALLGSLLVGYGVVYGNLFNPWFTVFSYLKGALLKITAVIAAGIVVLIFAEFRQVDSRGLATPGRAWMGIAALLALGFLPFAALEGYRETKAAMLQFNEYSMVDATYARGLADLLGVSTWVRLGQDPRPNGHPEPWPLPWTLEKTGSSLLPKDFNLVVIVVDALRGDAFHSAGYKRNLTPFLDQWAREEAISFRRAYSQGSGTFAAFPFLVAGRSRFTLYGPGLHHENLYFKIAQAEDIHTVMVVKGFGPRAIFPPDFPVIELHGSRPGTDQHSIPADEVFGWAQDAMTKLAKGERFLAFLHLMDVHNDLWKKADGLDFGDTPRDLYDNNVSYVDRAVGRFIAWLKEHGMYQRTVILLTADHGEQFWEHGASLHGQTVYEEEIHIPVIMLVHTIRARVENVPVIAADMAPTIAELAGYSVHPPYSDSRMGISLVPLLLAQERDRYLTRDIIGRASFKHRYFLYRNWQWKLVYSADFDLLQLFNTAQDPKERQNLLQEEPVLAARLERELFDYLERVEARSYRPLLDNLPRKRDDRPAGTGRATDQMHSAANACLVSDSGSRVGPFLHHAEGEWQCSRAHIPSFPPRPRPSIMRWPS